MRRRTLQSVAASILTALLFMPSFLFARDIPTSLRSEVSAAVASSNQFALELFARLSEEEGNLFFSPFSVSAAMAMTYAGAKDGTKAEMAGVLHFPLEEESMHAAWGALLKRLGEERGENRLHIANRLWGEKEFGFLDSYIRLTRDEYGAELQEMTFSTGPEAARQTINAWVADQTEQKIQDLIPPDEIDASTRLVLTNAIYFKGLWAEPFPEERTAPMPFFLTKTDSVLVPTMHRPMTVPFVRDEEIGADVARLSYETGRFHLLLLLPLEMGGMAEVEERIHRADIERWSVTMEETKLDVYLPRFQMTERFALAKTLSAMGMPNAFHAGTADFSGMNGERDLFLSEVFHKAFVEVNEEGTEAAAATAGVMKKSTLDVGEPVPFRANRPFLFLIRDGETGAFLFMGRVADPR